VKENILPEPKKQNAAFKAAFLLLINDKSYSCSLLNQLLIIEACANDN
jgi:hypothetical protein